MPARPYRPSGLSNDGGMARLFVACLGAAVASGAVEGFISHWISLFLLFPALLGIIVGAVGIRVIERSHIRSPQTATLIVLLAGLFAQLSSTATQYAHFRYDLRGQLHESQQITDLFDPAVDQILEQETGQRGFAGYMVVRARVGTELTNHGSRSGIKFQGTGFWILFVINYLIAGAIAAGMAWGRARLPYCEPCQRWYTAKQPVGNGSSDKSAVTETLQALDRAGFSDLPMVIGTPQVGKVSLIQLLRCDGCKDHEPQLTYTVITGTAKKQKVKNAYVTMLLPDQAQALIKAFEAAKGKEKT